MGLDKYMYKQGVSKMVIVVNHYQAPLWYSGVWLEQGPVSWSPLLTASTEPNAYGSTARVLQVSREFWLVCMHTILSILRLYKLEQKFVGKQSHELGPCLRSYTCNPHKAMTEKHVPVTLVFVNLFQL